MNYIICNGKIKAVTNIIKYSYKFKSKDNIKSEAVSGERYVLYGEDFNKIFHDIEFELSNDTNKDVNIVVETVDCSDILDFDGIEASSIEEAENIIKNLTLEEQLLEARFELDSLRLGIAEQ